MNTIDLVTLTQHSRPTPDHPTTDRTLPVQGEPTAVPELFITPTRRRTGAYSGMFTLTHAPTGRSVTSGQPSRLRQIAEKLVGSDWSFTDADSIPPATKAAALQEIRSADMTEPDSVELPAHPSWTSEGEGIKRAALPLAADMLAAFQWSWNKTMGSTSIPAWLPAEGNDRGVRNPEWDYHLHRQVDTYGLAYLLLALHRTDPEVADSAAADLADAWEAGDSLGEWAYEWAAALGRGEVPEVHGVPGTVEVFGETGGVA